jgi:hypothetical protein
MFIILYFIIDFNFLINFFYDWKTPPLNATFIKKKMLTLTINK